MRTVLVTHRQQAPAAAHIGFCQGLICPAPGQALGRLLHGCEQSGKRLRGIQIKAHSVGWEGQGPHLATRMTKGPACLSAAASTLPGPMTEGLAFKTPRFSNI